MIAEPKKMNPVIHLSSKEAPEIKKWKVGQKYKIELLVEQVGIREDYDKKNEYMGEFEVVEVLSTGKGVPSKKEYEKMSDEERDKADEKEVIGDD